MPVEWFLLFSIFNEVKVKYTLPSIGGFSCVKLVTGKSLFQLNTKERIIKLEPQFQCGRKADKIVH